MKLYVVVEVYQLIVSGVHVTEDEEDAKKNFKECTGVDYEEYRKKLDTETSEILLGDYDQTKIFEVDTFAQYIKSRLPCSTL